MHHPTDRIAHTTAFVTPVVEHWLEREIALCNSDVGDEFHSFSIVHLYLLKEMSTYLVLLQIEHVHFLFSIYFLPKKITFV